MSNEHIRFDDWLAEQMRDEELRTEYQRLAPGFQVAKLRMLRGLTQQELAARVGTHQSSISRLENGEREPILPFLRRVVAALDGCVDVQIRPEERRATVESVEAAAVRAE